MSFSAQKADAYTKSWPAATTQRRASMADTVKLSSKTLESLMNWIDEQFMEICGGSRIRLAYRGFSRGRQDTLLARHGYIVVAPIDEWLKLLPDIAVQSDDVEWIKALASIWNQHKQFKELIIMIIQRAQMDVYLKNGPLEKSEDQMLAEVKSGRKTSAACATGSETEFERVMLKRRQSTMEY